MLASLAGSTTFMLASLAGSTTFMLASLAGSTTFMLASLGGSNALGQCRATLFPAPICLPGGKALGKPWHPI